MKLTLQLDVAVLNPSAQTNFCDNITCSNSQYNTQGRRHDIASRRPCFLFKTTFHEIRAPTVTEINML